MQEDIEFDVPTQSQSNTLPDKMFPAACSWSLYPMGSPEYMKVIEKEITVTLNESKVEASRLHYASRLDGPLHEIFNTLHQAFKAVRAHVSHTVIHATVSAGSPSAPRQQIKL